MLIGKTEAPKVFLHKSELVFLSLADKSHICDKCRTSNWLQLQRIPVTALKPIHFTVSKKLPAQFYNYVSSYRLLHEISRSYDFVKLLKVSLLKGAY